MSWVTGVNYFRSTYDSSRDQDSSFSPFSSGLFDTEIDSQTFADVSYWLLDHLYLTAQYQYVGDREVDIQNTSELDAYHMVNGRLGWDDEGFNVYAFVNNLLDDEPEYFGSTYTPSVHSVAVGPGRVFGVGLRLTF